MCDLKGAGGPKLVCIAEDSTARLRAPLCSGVHGSSLHQLTMDMQYAFFFMWTKAARG
jgi:hypothetical protein